MIRPPALCRLCRRPLPHDVTRCPGCGARQTWDRRPPRERPRRSGWRITAVVLVLGVLVAAGVVATLLMRELRKPMSTPDETSATRGRLSPKECADALAELSNPRAESRLSAETRAQLRQCFEKR